MERFCTYIKDEHAKGVLDCTLSEYGVRSYTHLYMHSVLYICMYKYSVRIQLPTAGV